MSLGGLISRIDDAGQKFLMELTDIAFLGKETPGSSTVFQEWVAQCRTTNADDILSAVDQTYSPVIEHFPPELKKLAINYREACQAFRDWVRS